MLRSADAQKIQAGKLSSDPFKLQLSSFYLAKSPISSASIALQTYRTPTNPPQTLPQRPTVNTNTDPKWLAAPPLSSTETALYAYTE
ncbi:hypothetical protein NCS57_00307700 [Fusarium keratoplasticum]|uniref:Uncharacterized protein n=1 Tax=Fusarium keratoplasticum TaxID=1328300 RepID=A0ACC0RDN7_9HYPO|nr:hypothetical protein NCS57_00307700 [Fusarium keratoplasticum]KAI8680276.1 hypothetical protein NCS57_00307700 [Fusarium keratoplasticum]